MTHRRFHYDQEILIDFNTYLAWLNASKVLIETKLNIQTIETLEEGMKYVWS